MGRTGAGPNDVGLTRKHILASVEASLRRLQTDYIDLYQIHGYDPLTPLEETLRALDDLVQRGLVRYVGCSNLAAWQLMKALGLAERERLARFESLQAYYSIASRDLEREIVPLLQDQSVGLMVWSPLSGGLLQRQVHARQRRSGRCAPLELRFSAGRQGAWLRDRRGDAADRRRAWCIGGARGARLAAAAASRDQRDHWRQDPRAAR